MTTETMTIHKALAELKVLDKRIVDLLTEVEFIQIKKNNQEKVKGFTVEEFKLQAKANYNKITDLIKRRNAIKNAINDSNAVTEVEIGGEIYTVTKAIDKKNNGIQFHIDLRDALKAQYTLRKQTLEQHNLSLPAKAENFVTNLMGNKDTKTNANEYDEAVRTYIKSNSIELVDPLDILKQIEELDDMIDRFMPEVDAALSTSNALTTITINY